MLAFHLSVSRTGTGDGCLFFLEPQASDLEPKETEAGSTLWMTKTGIWLVPMRSKVGLRKISSKRVPPSNASLSTTAPRSAGPRSSWEMPMLCTRSSVQLLAARAPSERSSLLRGFPFPGTRTMGDENIDDLVTPSVSHFSDVHVDSSPIEVQRADA